MIMRGLLLVIAVCSLGNGPASKPAPRRARGTVTGHAKIRLHGPGANNGHAAFTNESPIVCTVQAGTAITKTGSDGAYTLRLSAGPAELSFASCAKGCCSTTPSTIAVEVKAGATTVVDWSCDCFAK